MIKLSQYINYDLHDKVITGIKVIDDNKVIFYITNNKENIKVQFLECKAVKFNNFLLGNIILSADIYEREDLVNIGDTLYDLFSVTKNTQYETFIKKMKKDLEYKNLKLIDICSSYGLNGFILCKEIKLLKR